MLEWIPDRPALCHDHDCTADLLVRISPPRQEVPDRRPELNLALVIDRSGSMGGQKIDLTRKAARHVVDKLTPQDHLAIVLFDDVIDSLLPSTRVVDKERIHKLIDSIAARGSTNLFDGWKTGAAQVCLSLDPKRLNRVVVLTDGQANVGETNPDKICDDLCQLAKRRVQTSTLGFGGGYNENLLRAMAASGEGNHFFVQTPDQLVNFFALELEGLAATLGTSVRLRLKGVEGVEIEPLSEVLKTPEGSYQLADMMVDCALEQLFRVRVPAAPGDEPPLTAELTWYCPGTATHKRLEMPLCLPRVSRQERLAMEMNSEVSQRLAVAMAARARREALAALNRGQKKEAGKILKDALDQHKLPAMERSQLEQLQQTVDRGDDNTSKKIISAQSHFYSMGSVSLRALHLTLLENCIASGSIPVRHGLILQQGFPPGRRPWERCAGMLAGLFGGEAAGRGGWAPRGEASELALATLPFVGARQKILTMHLNLVKAFLAAPVADPSESFKSLVERSQPEYDWGASPVRIADCGAVRRIAPLLLSNRLERDLDQATPDQHLAAAVMLGSRVTHNDCAACVSSLGFAGVMWDLMAMKSPPDPRFYCQRYLEITRDLELDTAYAAQGRHDGWKGRLSEFLEMVIPEARRRGLSVAEAQAEWGSGSSLLEAMPTVLYTLECHAHQPPVALRQATMGTRDPASLGAMVGAALGALHGRQPGWHLPQELAEAIENVAQNLK